MSITVLAWLGTDVMLQMVLALIMLGVGLSLRLSDFRYVLDNGRLLITGLALKILFLPLLGWLLAMPFALPVAWQFGILLLLFTPGGTTSNVITYWFGGTSALTIFLTTLSGFITILTIPLFVNWGSWYYWGVGTAIRLPFWSTVGNIFFVIVLPALLGLWVRHKRPGEAVKLERFLRPVAVVLLGLVYLIKFFAPSDAGGSGITMAEVVKLLPPLLLLNVVAMWMGFQIAVQTGINRRDSMTIGIEMGVQNAALALLIGSVYLQNEDFVKPALVYGMFTFWTTAAFGWVISRFFSRKKGRDSDI
ncbi:MAG: hypothetical protein R2795_06360 [Saprospiraceae bacterium]